MIFRTKSDLGPLMLRVALGGVMFPHGAQKAIGAFNGPGFTKTMENFTTGLQMPYVIGLLVIVAEFLGAIGLVFGFLTRVCALGILAVMIGAVAMVHAQHGFFMNWFGKQAGEGFEYHLLAGSIALVLLIKGGGAFSVDRAIAGGE